VAGIGAPSSLAIECAMRGELTVIGFLRADRFNCYAVHDRLMRVDTRRLES
jgi:FdhD protein